jgi:hypothetical protein
MTCDCRKRQGTVCLNYAPRDGSCRPCGHGLACHVERQLKGDRGRVIRMLEFDAPIRIRSEANSREHWRVKSDRRKAQQKEMDILLLNALQGRKIQLPCVVSLTRVGPKLMDDDNWINGAKGIRDAIARRLGIDDGDSRIKFRYDQEAIGRREYNVRVAIEST